jgi:hypothetical protein
MSLGRTGHGGEREKITRTKKTGEAGEMLSTVNIAAKR